MTIPHYRLLLTVHLLASLLYVGLGLAAGLHSEVVPAWGRAQSLLLMVLAGALIGAYGAMFFGLFTFQRWSRTLAVLGTAVSLALLIVLPMPGPATGWQALAYFVSTTSWGAVLALAYVGPVAWRFDHTITSPEP